MIQKNQQPIVKPRRLLTMNTVIVPPYFLRIARIASYVFMLTILTIGMYELFVERDVEQRSLSRTFGYGSSRLLYVFTLALFGMTIALSAYHLALRRLKRYALWLQDLACSVFASAGFCLCVFALDEQVQVTHASEDVYLWLHISCFVVLMFATIALSILEIVECWRMAEFRRRGAQVAVLNVGALLMLIIMIISFVFVDPDHPLFAKAFYVSELIVIALRVVVQDFHLQIMFRNACCDALSDGDVFRCEVTRSPTCNP